jgi:hypothetical protein
MTMTNGIKLTIYAHAKDKTYVDNRTINAWRDLNIFHVKVNPNHMSNQIYQEILEAVNTHAGLNKLADPVVLVGEEFEVEIYYVDEEKKPEPEHPTLELTW